MEATRNPGSPPRRAWPGKGGVVLCLLAAAGCEINVSGIDRDVDVLATESFQRTIAAPTQADLRIEAVNGEILVFGDPDLDAVEVDALKQVGSDSRRDANRWLDRVDIRITELGNEIRIETIQPRDNNGRLVEVDYLIRVPIDMNVIASHVNGSVEIETLDADAVVFHVNGDVSLLDVFGSASVDLVNGRVDAEVWLPEDGVIDLDVTNGDINLDVPASVSAELRARVTNGSVSVSGLTLIDPVTTSRSIEATLGGGRGLVDLETVNGTIRIRGF